MTQAGLKCEAELETSDVFLLIETFQGQRTGRCPFLFAITFSGYSDCKGSLIQCPNASESSVVSSRVYAFTYRIGRKQPRGRPRLKRPVSIDSSSIQNTTWYPLDADLSTYLLPA